MEHRRMWTRRLVASAAVLFLLTPLAQAASQPTGPLDLTTPRRALRLFIDAARAGDYDLAARVLDLRHLDASRRTTEGPRLARHLKFVLDQKLWIDWDLVADDPMGDPEDGPGLEDIGSIPLGADQAPIVLSREDRPDGTWRWRIDRRTVEAIPALYAAHGTGWLGDWLPDVFYRVRFLEMEAWQWLGVLLALLASALIALIFATLVYRMVLRITARTGMKWDRLLVDEMYPPVRLFLALAAFALMVEPLRLSVPAQTATHAVLRTLLVLTFTWLGLRLVRFVATTLEDRVTAGEKDAAQIRGVRTQIMVLRRVADVVVLVVGAALVLIQFEVVRTLGTSLLASAGVAGIVIGLAAQRSISTLLAGIQLSVTQPIRVGDTVIVENEWGWIEEITLTYVVVRVWDLRRLVVPMSRFLEQPFQNWTKVSPELLGTVMVWADYTVPVDLVRAEVGRIAEASALWDRRLHGLQVTEVTERTVGLRALVSAADAGKLWDLRCEVREGMVKFLQQLEGGRYLPKARVEAEGIGPAVAGDRAA